MPSTHEKTPGEVLDYEADWSGWMTEESDTIASSTWSAETGITIDSESNTTTLATVTLSGGKANRTYEVTNTVTTAGGRTLTRTLTINVVPIRTE